MKKYSIKSCYMQNRGKVLLAISFCTVSVYILCVLSKNKMTFADCFRTKIQYVSHTKTVHSVNEDSNEVETSSAAKFKSQLPSNLEARTTENPNSLLYTLNDVLPYDKNQHIVDLTDQSAVDSMKPEDIEEFLQRRMSGLLDGIKLRNLEYLLSFLDLPRVSCKQREKLIILVSSFCMYRNRRDVIRQTWGKYSKSHGVQTVFFVGQCEGAFAENKEMKDIVQANFVDNYFNVTLKTLSKMKWFNEFCGNTEMVLMCDDDVLVDSEAILKYYPRGKNLDFFCRLKHLNPIMRDSDDKWYVPKWLVNGTYWPDYCFGTAYMINSSIVPELYQNALDLPYVSIDDTLITGIARIKIQKHILSDMRFSNNKKHLILNCDNNSVFTMHHHAGRKMVEAWKKRVEICKLSVETAL